MAFHDTINTGTTPNDGQGDGLRTNIRKLHDNTKDNKQRLDNLNGNTPAVILGYKTNILKPLDALHHFNGAYHTGAIKISLPVDFNNCMITALNIAFFNYETNEAFSIDVSAYLRSSDSSWEKITATNNVKSSSSNYIIRLGRSNGKCCIYIGELNTDWIYLTVAVTNIITSYTNHEPEKWLTGWGISLETSSFENITATLNSNLPIAQ